MRFLLEYKRLGNIKNLGEAELAKLIETNLNQYSPTDANELMLSWCKQHFKNWKYIEAMYPLISDYIVDNGIKDINNKNNNLNNKNNNLWKFLDTFNAAKLTPSQANILYNCLTDKENDYYVKANEPLIHMPEAYRSDKSLQTYIFLSNKNNINRYGLGDKYELLRDLKGINNDRDLQKYINGKQTKFEASIFDELLTDSRTKRYFKNSIRDGELDYEELKAYLLKVSQDLSVDSDVDYTGLLNDVLNNNRESVISMMMEPLNDRDVIKAIRQCIKSLTKDLSISK